MPQCPDALSERMSNHVEVLCPKEVAFILGCSERTARRLMSQSIIPSFRVGEKILRTTRKRVLEYAARPAVPYARSYRPALDLAA